MAMATTNIENTKKNDHGVLRYFPADIYCEEQAREASHGREMYKTKFDDVQQNKWSGASNATTR
jgi:hypothetical protein